MALDFEDEAGDLDDEDVCLFCGERIFEGECVCSDLKDEFGIDEEDLENL